ncbi:MAG: cupin domain-containing protein [Myxococcota bacterium]|jgi:mannose-6-phosphate isomerase-like protein (cupin superfamily)|nr:cupin domain-containing protein [Myxococcota bacterium]
MKAINIQEKLDLFTELWSPRKIGELNGQQILLAKIQGEFVFHSHEHEDELFLVLKGQLVMELRDRTVVVNPGEFFTVPRGVEHRPTAEEETHVLLFEPLTTKHTGEVEADITVETYEEI